MGHASFHYSPPFILVLKLHLSPCAGQVQPQQLASTHPNSNAARAMHAFHPLGSPKVHNLGYSVGELDQLGVSAQQALLYSAEESLRQQAAAQLGAHLADFGQAATDPGPASARGCSKGLDRLLVWLAIQHIMVVRI